MAKPTHSGRRDAEQPPARSRQGTDEPQFPSHVSYPITPIPARASAQAARKRAASEAAPTTDEDITRIPTVPQRPGGQRARAGRFQVQSSLASLARVMSELSPVEELPIDEMDTQPSGGKSQRPISSGRITRELGDDPFPAPMKLRASRPPAVPRQASPALPTDPAGVPLQHSPSLLGAARAAFPDEIRRQLLWTPPPEVSHLPISVEQETLKTPASPVMNMNARQAPQASYSSTKGDLSTWTTGHWWAVKDDRSFSLEGVRWWLLHPGRLEFLFRSAGVILLVCATSLLVFVGALSLGLGQHSSPTTMTQMRFCDASSSAGSQACFSITAQSPAGLKESMPNGDLLVSGASLRLQGQGFSPHGMVKFTHDANLACEPANVQVDSNGSFTVVMRFANDPDWQPGQHQMTIYDVVSKHTVVLSLLLTHS